MSATAAQATILQSLRARDAREKASVEIIDAYTRLVQQASAWKEQNAALVRAASRGGAPPAPLPPAAGSSADEQQQQRNGSPPAAGNGSCVAASVADERESRADDTRSSDTPNAAYIAGLEAQLLTVRYELNEQYKVQSSNAQRLLKLTDELRLAEERGREERDELGRLRTQVEALRERSRWHTEVVAEKEKMVVVRLCFSARRVCVCSKLKQQAHRYCKTSCRRSTSSSRR